MILLLEKVKENNSADDFRKEMFEMFETFKAEDPRYSYKDFKGHLFNESEYLLDVRTGECVEANELIH